jgi:tetratricopeptide (TPR) repeat protein
MEMAIAARWLGDVDDALDNFREAIRLFTSDGDLTGRARAVLEVGQLFETLGQTEPAYEAYQLAASIAEHYLDPALRRQALNGLAGLALHNDRPAQALDLLNAALTTYVGSEEPDGQTLSQLGAVLLKLGRLEDSIKAHAQALETLQEAGDLPRLARAHLRMGSACHAAGLHDEALHHLQTGLDCMRALGDAFGQARLLTNLGVLYEERSHSSEALANWQDALALQEHLHDQIGMATTLFNIADLESRLGHLDDAQAHMEEAYQLAQHVNLPSLLKLIRSHPLYNA